MILSLQGCMAVGKTTALTYLQKNAPYINVCFENNGDIIEEVKRRNLYKNKYEDFLEIQKLWIDNEVNRYQEATKFPCSVMDFGAEEIEFYTLNYPKSIGENWETEPLHKELEALRQCMPTRILFLDAADEILRAHKEKDSNRSRNSFEHYLKNLLPLKREWFFKKSNVDILRIDGLDTETVGKKVKDWCDNCIASFDADNERFKKNLRRLS